MLCYLQAPFVDFNFDLEGEWAADYFEELKEEMKNDGLKIKLEIWQVDEFDKELDDLFDHLLDDLIEEDEEEYELVFEDE